MAREAVVKLQCDRCKKIELVPPQPEKALPDFQASFLGNHLIYQDLCSGCKETVQNIWTDLEEWDRERKYTILKHGPALDNNQAAPLSPAPNYTPVQPHSAAAAKR